MGASKRFSYANVMATFAVFVAIGGGAYAAGLSKNSVGTKQLKDEAVTPPKIADATVDLFEGQRGAVGPRGATGPGGVAGGTGATGHAGATGPVGPTSGALGSGLTSPSKTGSTTVGTLTTTTINLPTAGRIWATGRAFDFGINGGQNTCALWLALYVDGQPVPGGGSAAWKIAPAISTFGLTSTVAAGAHTVELAFVLAPSPGAGATQADCNAATPSFTFGTHANPQVGAIAIGG